ncbi:hypothetical protein NBRC116595_10260 [Aliiglaciecola sp. NS0011-25]
MGYITKFFSFLHGKGHQNYKSKAAKNLYALQLISLSEKVLWVMFAPFASFLFNSVKVPIFLACIMSLVFLVVGLYFRHEGLNIIDEIETKDISNSESKE